MAREISKQMNRFFATQIGALPDGRHHDGGGLYLLVSRGGTARSWLFRYRSRVTGKLRDLGLGPVTELPLKEARARAAELRRQLLDGLDPFEEKARVARERAEAEAARLEAERAAKRVMTFGQATEKYLEAHRAGWRNAKHAQQWENTLKTHAGLLKDLPVAEINQDEVCRVLDRIWTRKPETAARVRGRIEAVLDWATARGYRSGNNPARWRGHLDMLLPPRGKVAPVEHHPAMPWSEMPGFIEELRKGASLSARALEFVILTVCRVGEAAAAQWSEFDLEAATWTVPAARMKAGKEHRVALSPRAVEILKALPRVAGSDYVFAGLKERAHINPESLRKFLKVDMKQPLYTVHGFRSSFRDWAAETTDHSSETIEAALAHTVRNATERAYRRGDQFAKRARLMAHWDNYLSKRETDGLGVRIGPNGVEAIGP